LTPSLVVAYLERVGVAASDATADLAGLQRLHAAHLRTIPFENLSVHLGEPIVLDASALLTKLTSRGRGGFCYEMNGGFAAVLSALGFSVTLLEGRVYQDGTPGISFDHLCLRVDLDRPYLADVGFGASFGLPLRLDSDAVQDDPNGPFRIAPLSGVDAGWFDLEQGGRAQYRFSRTPHELADFAGGCTYHQTSPDSPFTKNSLCTLPVGSGRVTIAGRLLVTRIDGVRDEREVTDDAELLALYREHFGIELDRVPPR
jgi:N-hydroxyarylamine O-acetyltransferase